MLTYTRSEHILFAEYAELLDWCEQLYEPVNSLLIRLRYPRYWAVEHLGFVGA